MTLTIELNEAVFGRIKSRAARAGQAPENYLALLAERDSADETAPALIGDAEFQKFKNLAFAEHAETLKRLAR